MYPIHEEELEADVTELGQLCDLRLLLKHTSLEKWPTRSVDPVSQMCNRDWGSKTDRGFRLIHFHTYQLELNRNDNIKKFFFSTPNVIGVPDAIISN